MLLALVALPLLSGCGVFVLEKDHARLAAQQEASDKTMADAKFIDEAAKNDFKVEPMTGEDLAATLARAYGASPEIIKRTREVLGRAEGGK